MAVVTGRIFDSSFVISYEAAVTAPTCTERGYTTHFMTGIAWGEYQDYFTGAWDGRAHFDEGQVPIYAN